MLSDRKIEERNARKAQILDGALTVFKTHGIEKTTMDQVAVESGFGIVCMRTCECVTQLESLRSPHKLS